MYIATMAILLHFVDRVRLVITPRTYEFHTYFLAWDEATSMCEERGGSLARIYDLSTIPDLELDNKPVTNTKFWTGLREMEGDEWRWVGGNVTSTWTNWSPVDVVTGHCVAASIVYRFWWNRINCQTELPFVCEYQRGSCSYVRVRESSIIAHNDLIVLDKSPEQCMAVCDASISFTCRSFEYNIDYKYCQLSSHNRWTRDGYYKTNDKTWDYYHRKCNTGILSMDTRPESTTVFPYLFPSTEDVRTTFSYQAASSSVLTSSYVVTTSYLRSSSWSSLADSRSWHRSTSSIDWITSSSSPLESSSSQYTISSSMFTSSTSWSPFSFHGESSTPVFTRSVFSTSLGVSSTKIVICTELEVEVIQTSMVFSQVTPAIVPSATTLAPVQEALLVLEETFQEIKQKNLRKKKISVPDSRPSATTVGYIAGIVMFCVIGGVIILDLGAIFRDIKLMKRNIQRARSQKRSRKVVLTFDKAGYKEEEEIHGTRNESDEIVMVREPEGLEAMDKSSEPEPRGERPPSQIIERPRDALYARFRKRTPSHERIDTYFKDNYNSDENSMYTGTNISESRCTSTMTMGVPKIDIDLITQNPDYDTDSEYDSELEAYDNSAFDYQDAHDTPL